MTPSAVSNWRISPSVSSRPMAETIPMIRRSERAIAPTRAEERMKSPISTATRLSKSTPRVGRPRRVFASSMTSSWMSVAVWISSSSTAASMLRCGGTSPRSSPAMRAVRMGRTCFPVEALRCSMASFSHSDLVARIEVNWLWKSSTRAATGALILLRSCMGCRRIVNSLQK